MASGSQDDDGDDDDDNGGGGAKIKRPCASLALFPTQKLAHGGVLIAFQ